MEQDGKSLREVRFIPRLTLICPKTGRKISRQDIDLERFAKCTVGVRQAVKVGKHYESLF